MRFRVGVDTGGTFTDCVVIDERGTIHTFKELSTPKDPSVGLYNVVRKAAAAFSMTLYSPTDGSLGVDSSLKV